MSKSMHFIVRPNGADIEQYAGNLQGLGLDGHSRHGTMEGVMAEVERLGELGVRATAYRKVIKVSQVDLSKVDWAYTREDQMWRTS